MPPLDIEDLTGTHTIILASDSRRNVRLEAKVVIVGGKSYLEFRVTTARGESPVTAHTIEQAVRYYNAA